MRSNTLPVLIALVVLAGAAYWFAAAETPTVVTKPVEPAEPGEVKAATTQTGRIDDPELKRTPDPDIRREEVKEGETGSKADSPQGVKGRLVSPTGLPIAGAEVFLIRGMGIDAFQLLLRFQKGERFPPLATAISAADGSFQVGLEEYDPEKERTYEVRILHADFCDHRIERIDIQPQDWFDAQDVVLKHGVTLFGSVLSETGAPIPAATVTAKPQFSHGVLSVPGRETGIETKTDSFGNYEITNVDPLDLMSLTAHALNHTRLEKTELNLQGNRPPGDRVQIDFQLESGFEIGGVVVDELGNPVRGAKITANAISQKAPQSEETYSRADGSFFVIGLREGRFSIVVDAHGFARAEEKPIKAGDAAVSVVLEKLGSVEVTVLGRNRAPVTSYTCNIKPVISGNDNFGKPMLTQQVRNATGGTATVSGLKPLRYVAEIIHGDYAKNFSAPFEIVAGQTESAMVQVQLNEGGTLRGLVQDMSGKPVGGVEILTQPKGMIENKLIQAFGGLPYTITRGVVKSKADGTFEFKRLLPGEYQLKYKHRDFCTLFTNDNVAVLDQVTDLPPVSLERGVMVSGIARVEGQPTGQVKVTISAKVDKDKPTMFNTEAITDNEGRFLLPKRLPPGQYEARGAQMSGGPFAVIMQFQKITKFTVGSGKEHYQLVIDVPPLPK